MKKRVVVELPLRLANWLLNECVFHQSMLQSNLLDLDGCECHPCLKNQLLYDFDNYRFLQRKVANAVSRCLSKQEVIMSKLDTAKITISISIATAKKLYAECKRSLDADFFLKVAKLFDNKDLVSHAISERLYNLELMQAITSSFENVLEE